MLALHRSASEPSAPALLVDASGRVDVFGASVNTSGGNSSVIGHWVFEPAAGWSGWLHDVGMAWLALGVGGLLFRTVHIFFLADVRTGLVWATKILTDPFHDVMLYWRSPLHLLRGERIDPMHHARHP